MAENIHKGHRERVRQKFIKNGFTGFLDHEKLELLLFYSRPRVDTNEIAHRLIDQFKTITGVFDADIESLKEIEGVDNSTAILLKLIPELAKEYLKPQRENLSMGSFKGVCEYFKSQFLGEKNEKIRIACINDKLKLVDCTVIAEGTPGSVSLNIRKIVEFTYKNKCESIIMAHNHPNGDLIPSDEDIKATSDIFNTLKPVGIMLLDHIIVAGGQAISLKESGAFTLLK
ncbi:JAB domain-containing protein [Porcipelethomonas sp.]|uniref:JAB domain-containing protein n=1 Tax=Porcipelethomonas sp. TaxID=2981675 RepID=UPI003EF331F3